LVYDGANWLNNGLYTLRYGLTGNFNQSIGTLVVLNGFDLAQDITVPDVPAKDLVDVENEINPRQYKLTAGAGVAIVETDPLNPVIKSVTAYPDVNAPSGVPADAQSTGGIIAGLTTSSKSRGTVLNALTSQGTCYTIDTLTVTAAGSGYSVGDALILPMDPLDAIVVVKTVGGGGALTDVEVSKSGNSTNDFAGDIIPQGGTGVGAKFTVTTVVAPNSTLEKISNPVQNDSADVLQDELHDGSMYEWQYADFNGDGICNWVPIGPSARNFAKNPITASEISSGAVGGANMAANGVSYEKLDTSLQAKVDEIANKEETSNKTTTIAPPDTASDVKYPSEKAVAESLAALAPKLLGDVGYYVSWATGNDANDGETEATALQTVAEVIRRISATGINYTQGSVEIRLTSDTTESFAFKDFSSSLKVTGYNRVMTVGEGLSILNCSDVTLESLQIGPSGSQPSVYLSSSRAHLMNCRFEIDPGYTGAWFTLDHLSQSSWDSVSVDSPPEKSVIVYTGSILDITYAGSFTSLRTPVAPIFFSERGAEIIWGDTSTGGLNDYGYMFGPGVMGRFFSPWFTYDPSTTRAYTFKTPEAFEKIYPYMSPGALYVNEWESGNRLPVNQWDYSYDEVRIGTFADGRGVYKKTYHPNDYTTTGSDFEMYEVMAETGVDLLNWTILHMEGGAWVDKNHPLYGSYTSPVSGVYVTFSPQGTWLIAQPPTSNPKSAIVVSDFGPNTDSTGKGYFKSFGEVFLVQDKDIQTKVSLVIRIVPTRGVGCKITDVYVTVYYAK
jgi:hypothetical protein